MKRTGNVLLLSALLLFAFSLFHNSLLAGEVSPSHAAHPSATDPTAAGWSDRLTSQIDDEYAAEGQGDLRTRIDAAMGALMSEIDEAPSRSGEPANASAPFHGMAAMQQMDRSFYLGPATVAESVTGGGHCPQNTPRKEFDITAMEVEITLNRWGDYHPGYMYALTGDVEQIQKEEQRNADARAPASGAYTPAWMHPHPSPSSPQKATDPGAISTGLQTDLIQPLVLRANQGDCVIITIRNAMKEEDVGLHIHGSSLIVQSTGQPVTSANRDATIKAGKSQRFEWYIRPDEQEGSHMLHSHVGREQTSLGMMGAFIVEPMGSSYLDPLTGKEMTTGWQAMIVNPSTPDFREFVIFYHEVGDKSFRTLNRQGEMTIQRDVYTDAYTPGHRALNYRSEPFGMNNLALQDKYFHFEDESLSYSAYTFGDTSTPIPRSYMGDPAKFRLIHGGSEVFHSHHPHGGTIRWLRQPNADGKAGELLTTASEGPVKFPVIRTTSDRIDAQMIGPSEALDLNTECGSGLCQQLAGDFLFHCHVAHHYVAGMWSYWRVYNTLQNGDYPLSSTDIMPPLVELPDRKGRMNPAVTSDQLVGYTMNWYDKQWAITPDQSDWSKPIPNVSIKDWVAMMLPPPGQPGHTADEKEQIMAFDATVWDWTWDGNKAMGEPEATGDFPWPKYLSPIPGKRPPVLFEPKTGKLAWPNFKPHFGKRPPFAPNHGPAPWLEPIHMVKNSGALPSDPGGRGAHGESTTQPARPGEQGRWSLCPEIAGRKQFTIHAVETPITWTQALGNLPPVIDQHGLIYVLQDEEEVVRHNDELKRPLVYRANVYDCVDVILKSEWSDNDTVNMQMSKVNIHPHFIQFDTQASDGVITGFSYEQSVRPFTEMKKEKQKGLPTPMNATLAEDVKAGTSNIKLIMADGATPLHVGTELMLGMEQVKTSEIRRIKTIDNNTITFTEPLSHPHQKGEIASVEFVRYRYWVDADIGTVFWHDHAMGIATWPHGAVGAMIVEPWGSTYHDPRTGASIRSGPIADIHSTEPIGYGVNGSFRELVVMPHDMTPTTAQVLVANLFPNQTKRAQIDAAMTLSFQPPHDLDTVTLPSLNGFTVTTGSGLDLRAESVARRLRHNPEPRWIFSSLKHQDPSTPLLRAYLGDTVVFRLLHTMMNETHTWHVAGHTFRMERYAKDSPLRNALHVGIAERFDLVTTAGGTQQMAGDYLHFNGRASHLSEGSWGIIRVLDKETPDLQKLPGREVIPASAKSVCPAEAPVKSFSVVAVNQALKFNNKAPNVIPVEMDRKIIIANPMGKVFMLEGDKTKVATGATPMPLTLHVNVGDCVKVTLKNEMKESRASFSADGMAFDPKDSQGINVGNNPGDQTVGPGQSRLYTFYAPAEYGETAALVWDWGNFINNVRDGLFGAIVVGPKGSKYRDSVTGEDVTLKNDWQVDVLVDRSVPENALRPDYRDASLFFQDEEQVFETSLMPYTVTIPGLTGVNYRSEPWYYREDQGCEPSNMFTPCLTSGRADPVTPTIQAQAGDAVRIHVFGAFSEQNGVFGLEGHEWPLSPKMAGSDLLSSSQFGASENLDLVISSAGGPFRIPGDYLWQNHRLPYTQAGQWGYFRVLPINDHRILPLESTLNTRIVADDSSNHAQGTPISQTSR